MCHIAPYIILIKQSQTSFRSFVNELDMNGSDYDNRTPLHLAACEGHYACVKFLLQVAKADPDPKDRLVSL